MKLNQLRNIVSLYLRITDFLTTSEKGDHYTSTKNKDILTMREEGKIF